MPLVPGPCKPQARLGDLVANYADDDRGEVLDEPGGDVDAIEGPCEQPAGRLSRVYGPTMPSKDVERLCVFCREREPGHPEHVLPQWLGKCRPPGAKVMVHFAEDEPAGSRRVFEGKATSPQLVNRAVCTDCNGGWMSDLETAVSAFLRPIIMSDDKIGLDAGQQADLAFWAFKTALMYEQTMHLEHQAITPSAYAWAYREQCPAPGTEVRLVYLGDLDTRRWLYVRRATLSPESAPSPVVPDPGAIAEPGDDEPTTGIRCAFFLGHVGLEVVWSNIGTQLLDAWPAHIKRLMPKLWPIHARSLRWPPREGMTVRSFRELIDHRGMVTAAIPDAPGLGPFVILTPVASADD